MSAACEVHRLACRLAAQVVVALVAIVALGGLAAGAAASRTTACTTSRLVVWLDTQGDHAAGSSYYRLMFTNLAARACTLRGYPGVSAVDLQGHQLGSAAARDRGRPVKAVSLASGASAAAVLRIADAYNYPRSACAPRTAAGLRVYAPDETAPRVVPFPFAACSRRGHVYLGIDPVRR